MQELAAPRRRERSASLAVHGWTAAWPRATVPCCEHVLWLRDSSHCGTALHMAGKNRCRSLGFSLCENCQWLFNPTDGSDAKVDPRSDRSYYRKLPCDNAGKGQSTGGARASEGAQRAAAAQSELAGLDPRGPAPHPSAAAVPLPVPRSRRRGADTGHAAPPAAVPRKRKQAVAFAPTDTPRANGWRLDLSMASELQQQIKSARARP